MLAYQACFLLLLSTYVTISCFAFIAIPTIVKRNHPKYFAASKDSDSKPVVSEQAKRQFRFADLIQLIAMGAGAPGLGEFDRIDPETGKMFFKLDANNLVDSKGDSVQMKAKYFNEGYVAGSTESGDDFEVSPPGFWSNLISGGKLQSEWEEKIQRGKK